MAAAPFGAAPVISDGQYTSTLYGWIRDGKYADVELVLRAKLRESPKSRAALSLLGYVLYQTNKFHEAASTYEALCRNHGEVEEYKLYYAQALFKSGAYPEAVKAAHAVPQGNQSVRQRVANLLAAIKYEQGDYSGCRSQLEQVPTKDADTVVNSGCILFKEGLYEEARLKFDEAMKSLGYQPDLAYNISLCFYKQKQFGPALKYLAEIIERGVREHPELSVGSYTDGMEVRSVGNSQTLKETALVESFNLKAAIEYIMHNFEATKEALTDMPPRAEEELDPVTLHNTALMNMDTDPTGGFKKLNYLLSNPPYPPETFGNLLLLYCKPAHAFFDLAADVLAENTHLVSKHLTRDLYDYLEATILRQTSAEEAFHKYDALANRHVDVLRRLTKRIQDARIARDNDQIKRAISEYDEALEAYIPGLMASAHIYWEMENYSAVERIFRQSAEFCSEHDVWKLNVAHTFFMQENKFKEAIRYYEPAVKKHSENLLDVTAIVLANLCVSYIMTSQNEEAEDLMRKIEKEEERLSYQDPTKECFHLCIVNLVIGTLYCAKQNFEFGIQRIIRSLEPYSKKIETDTWFYAKRCFLALIEQLSKHMVMVKDATFQECFSFLEEAEKHGAKIPTSFNADGSDGRTVAIEARAIRSMLMKMRE
ncbi:tetratricopeptide repeat protein 30 [Pycnococcus provasolii]